MKVDSPSVKNFPSKKPSPEDIKAKIKAKFGKDLNEKPKVEKIEDKNEVRGEKGVKASSEDGFGDIGTNDPNSKETQEKLKGLLKSGAFQFNDREREALSSILMKKPQ